MRTKEVLATIAVVGAVATFALLNAPQQGESLFRQQDRYIEAF